MIRVPTLPDNHYYEGNEQLLMELSHPVGYARLATSSAIGTIFDVVAPEVRVSNTEADEGQVLIFEVTLDRAGDQPAVVEYASGGGTASQGLDYLRAAGVLRFEPGETRKTIEVAALADEDDEDNEHFFITLSNAIGAVIGDPSGEGRIINLDPPTIAVADRRVVEGSSAVFEVVLNNRASRAITLDFAAAAQIASGAVAATADADFTAATGSVVVPAGSTTATVAVATTEDQLDEYDETFRLVFSNPDYGNLADPVAVGTIEDDDPLPSLSAADAFAAENAGTASVAVTLSEPSGRNVAIDYTTADATATAADDYTAISGTLAIPAGRTTATIDIALIDDDADEGPETLALNLSNPLNASVADGNAQITIGDDEGLPTAYLDLHSSGTPEGDPAEITVVLSHPAAGEVNIDYSTADGTAVAPGDYTAVSTNTLTFGAGETEQTLSTPTEDDDEIEDTETFTWSMTNPTGAVLATWPGTSQIIDDDSLPDLTVDDTRIAEGRGPLRFTVQLTSPPQTR